MSRRAALGSEGPAAQTSQPRSKSQEVAERTDPAQTCSLYGGGTSSANKVNGEGGNFYFERNGPGKKRKTSKGGPRTRSRTCRLVPGTVSLISSQEARFLPDFNALEKCVQPVRRRLGRCESPSWAPCVFAFNAGFLRDHMNGAFLVLWPLLGRGGLGAPGQPVSREPLRADQADLCCSSKETSAGSAGAQPRGFGQFLEARCAAVSLPTKRG